MPNPAPTGFQPNHLLDAMAHHDGAGVRIAVIDTGIEHHHPLLQPHTNRPSDTNTPDHVPASYVATPDTDGNMRIKPCEALDVCGHGTATASQIRRIAPGADLVSIRVLSETRQGSSQALVAALQWVNQQSDIALVNMSLSTLRLALALQIGEQVDALYAKGVPCVCAKGYQQQGKDYPTCFGASIGVTYQDLAPAELRYREHDLVEFEAPGIDQTVAWQNGTTRKVTGSSYAAPIVTGLIARLLQTKPQLTVFEAKALLKAYADRYTKGWRQNWMHPPTPARSETSAHPLQ